jgi:asparagine synthase (glutamine-hydrolysing)
VLNGDGGVHVERLAAFVGPAVAKRVLTDTAAAALSSRNGLAEARPPALLAHALAFDQQTYLQSLLNRMDKMSMAASVEGRVPFLDHRVVELAAQVPPSLKIRGLETKFLLKHLARRHLPAPIIDRRKAGFAVPVTAWLRPEGPLAPYVDMLLEPRTTQRGYLELAELRRLVEDHRLERQDYGELLWGLINLELWQRTMIDTPQNRRRQLRRVSAVEGVPARL